MFLYFVLILKGKGKQQKCLPRRSETQKHEGLVLYDLVPSISCVILHMSFILVN